MIGENGNSMDDRGLPVKVAIQGELGSNSHMAALAMLQGMGEAVIEIVPCAVSAEVFERVLDGTVDGAVLPIENSLHGSVAEHYDLLLAQPVRIARESLLRVRHNLIARPGVKMEQIRRVISHPVALSQCRNWLAARPQFDVVNFYDTAGSVKHLMAEGLDDTAGIAPVLAASNMGLRFWSRGLRITRRTSRDSICCCERTDGVPAADANKSSLAFSVEHRPGSLVRALEVFAAAGVDLTKIESRPVPGMPWEYVFFVDLRFGAAEQIDAALARLGGHCQMVKELGRYVAA